MINKQRVIILSAELNTNNKDINLFNSDNLELSLIDNQINFKKGIGCYKGNSEDVFVCTPNNKHEVDVIKGFAFQSFGQESILEQDVNGLCHLEYSDGTSKSVGMLKVVNPKLIEQLDNYTILDGKVWTTEEI